MKHGISPLSEHCIICAAGGVGTSAARESARKPVPFLIIEHRGARARRSAAENWLTMVSDATEDRMLGVVQMKRARGLVATTRDATNRCVVLSARALNADLKMVAPATENTELLLTAGPGALASPRAFGGQRTAESFPRPHLVGSLNTVTTDLGVDLEIDADYISNASHLVGKTMEGSRIGQHRGATVLAIKRRNGRRFNLALEDPIEAGDLPFAMGEPREFRRLKQLATS